MPSSILVPECRPVTEARGSSAVPHKAVIFGGSGFIGTHLARRLRGLDCRVTVADIVQQAGVTQGSFYHHFDSKEELFRAVFAQVEHDWKADTIGQSSTGAEVWASFRRRRRRPGQDSWTVYTEGVLDFVENRVDPTTGTLRVRGVFQNPAPERVLEPGFFARARVPGSAKYRALLIPDQAVGTDQGQKFVYVVDDQDTVQSRKVVLGPAIQGLRVVRDGVQSNDWVLVNGLMSVRPGAKVKAAREEIGAPHDNAAATAQQ